MTAEAARGRRGTFAAILARAEAWLLEPGEAVDQESVVADQARLVVAVVGLARGCGTTTIARALGATLAVRDPAGACVVSCAGSSARLHLAAPAAAGLARALGPSVGGGMHTAGRLCLAASDDHTRLARAARDVAPLVLDVGHGSAPAGPASIADHVVLVASPDSEPALAAVVGRSLARPGVVPLTVVNRGRRDNRSHARGALVVPASRLGAQLALSGREPRGGFGAAIEELADRVAGAR